MTSLLTILRWLAAPFLLLWRLITATPPEVVERAEAIKKARARQAANAGFGGRRG